MASLPESNKYLSADELDRTFRSSRKSVDYLSEFDEPGTDASSNSSFWENSEADSTDTDDISTEHSGSEHESDLSDVDLSPEQSDVEAPEPYKLRLRKRAQSTVGVPSAK